MTTSRRASTFLLNDQHFQAQALVMLLLLCLHLLPVCFHLSSNGGGEETFVATMEGHVHGILKCRITSILVW